MSARSGCWILGVFVAILLASFVDEATFPAVRVVVAAVVMVAMGLAGECFAVWKSRQNTKESIDDREADGCVEVATVIGIQHEPNRNDERFGAFLGIGGDVQLVRDDPRSFHPRRSPSLLGKIVIVSLFLGRDGRAWSERELADAHAELIRAGEWIEREARRYRARVNVELADTYFVHDDETPEEVAIGFQGVGDDVGPFEQAAGIKALARASRAAVALGFQDAYDLLGNIGARLRTDETVWLLHLRQAGRSFALAREDSGWDGISLAVCYPKEASFPERLIGPAHVDPVTVVHELLHLFGATDKYGRSLRSFAPDTVTGREVMRLDETRLSRLRVDPSTAAELGWPRRGPLKVS